MRFSLQASFNQRIGRGGGNKMYQHFSPKMRVSAFVSSVVPDVHSYQMERILQLSSTSESCFLSGSQRKYECANSVEECDRRQ